MTTTDTKLLAREKRRARQSTVIRAILYIPLFLIIMLVVGGALGAIWGGLFFLGFLSAVALMYPFIRRKQRSKRVVVWLRRFHRPEMTTFERMLNKTCAGIAVPVTLRDSSVRSSEAYMAASPLRALTYLVAGFAAFGLALELGDLLHDRFPEIPAFLVKMVLLILLSFIASPIVMRVKERMGFTRLANGEEGLRRVQRLLSGVEEKSGSSSLVLLAVPDDIWQPVVESCLAAADAVIVDVTELTENIEWELGTCSRHLRPEQLVMLRSAARRTEDALPEEVRQLLEGLFGSDVGEASVITYEIAPRGLGRLLPGLAMDSTARRYQPELLAALAKAFRAAGSLWDSRDGSVQNRPKKSVIPNE